MRLSYSSIEKYKQCARKWKLHYVDRLRPTQISSPLFFGGAVDDALNALLLTKKKDLNEEEQELVKKDPITLFKGNMTPYRGDSEVVYSKADIDLSIINDLDPILKVAHSEGFISLSKDDLKDFIEEQQDFIKRKQRLSEASQRLYNEIGWQSLVAKGEMLINGYREEIMPQIHEVKSIQHSISLPNEEGDEIIGNIDFIASFTDNPEEVYIIDNKTSARSYPDNCFDDASQLAFYCEAMQNYKASYIVLEKNIRKRDPQVRINIKKGDISDQLLEKTFDKAEEVLYNIREEKFPTLENKKKCWFFGRKCEYFNYCWNGKDTTGLLEKE